MSKQGKGTIIFMVLFGILFLYGVGIFVDGLTNGDTEETFLSEPINDPTCHLYIQPAQAVIFEREVGCISQQTLRRHIMKIDDTAYIGNLGDIKEWYEAREATDKFSSIPAEELTNFDFSR